MTELMIRDESPNALETYGTAAMASLADWANEARAAATLAASICKTSFVPDHFRNKPEETTAAILTGHELGLSPMASVRGIYVFKGTPGMYAKTMVAVLQSKGHEVWVESQSDESVTVCARRKGSEHIARCTWDTARVVKAKLTSNAKYQENPQQMLYARAATEACRQIAMDALMGMPYAVEEIDDFDDRPVRAEVVERPRISAAAITGMATEREPELPAQEMITDAQQRKLRAVLSDLGLGGSDQRDQVLGLVSDILGRRIGSSKELTKAAAIHVIDQLENMLAARQTAQQQDAAAEDGWPEAAEIPEG